MDDLNSLFRYFFDLQRHPSNVIITLFSETSEKIDESFVAQRPNEFLVRVTLEEIRLFYELLSIIKSSVCTKFVQLAVDAETPRARFFSTQSVKLRDLMEKLNIESFNNICAEKIKDQNSEVGTEIGRPSVDPAKLFTTDDKIKEYLLTGSIGGTKKLVKRLLLLAGAGLGGALFFFRKQIKQFAQSKICQNFAVKELIGVITTLTHIRDEHPVAANALLQPIKDLSRIAKIEDSRV
jgi:hypothetical protein